MYLASKVAGFQKDGDQWDIIMNTLMSLGLALDSTAYGRANAQPGFTFVKPADPEDASLAIHAISTWLGLDQVKSKVFEDKIKSAKTNEKFEKATFQVVLKQIQGEEDKHESQ